jgi:hypothetical protein
MPLYEKRRRAASKKACLGRVGYWLCGATDQRREKRAVPQSNDHITLQAVA